jgi:hypothetical protein
MDLMSVIATVSMLGSVIAVWVQLNGRLVRLETENRHVKERIDSHGHHTDKQFDAIMSHLRRIEDKLDGKADRER